MADLAELDIAVNEKGGSISDVDRKLDQLNDNFNRFQAGSSLVTTGLQAITIGAAAAAAAVGTLGFAAVQYGRSAIAAAAEVEALEQRLVGLAGSTELAREQYERFRDVAAKTPFNLQEVAQAGVQLEAMTGQADAALDAVTDLAAFMGRDLVTAAFAFGRAWSAGFGASEILREAGILNVIQSFKGIEDVSKLTLPEFRRALFETMVDPAGPIAGASDRIAASWAGMTSNVEDALFTLRAEVGDVIVRSEALKAVGIELARVISEVAAAVRVWRLENQSAVDNELLTYMGSVSTLAIDITRGFADASQGAAQFARALSGLEVPLAALTAVGAAAAIRFGRITEGAALLAIATKVATSDFGAVADNLEGVADAANAVSDELDRAAQNRAFVAGIEDLGSAFRKRATELEDIRSEIARVQSLAERPENAGSQDALGAVVAGLQQQAGEVVAFLDTIAREFRARGEEIPEDVRKMAAAVGVELPRALREGVVPDYGDVIGGELGKASEAVNSYRQAIEGLSVLLDSSDPFEREGAGEAIRQQTVALLGLADASRIAADAEKRRIAEAEAVARISERLRNEAQQAADQARNLRLTVRPDEQLRARLSEIQALAVANPAIITPEVRADLFIEEAKRIQDASRDTVDVVGNLFEGMATRVEDSLVDALERGRFEVKEFGRAILLDLAQLSIREGVTRPFFNSLASAYQDAQAQRDAVSAIRRVGFDINFGGGDNGLGGSEIDAELAAAGDSARQFSVDAVDAGSNLSRGTINAANDMQVGARNFVIGAGQAVSQLFSLLLGSSSGSFGEAIGYGALSGLIGGVFSAAGSFGAGSIGRTSPGGAAIDPSGDFFPGAATGAASDIGTGSVALPQLGGDTYRPPAAALSGAGPQVQPGPVEVNLTFQNNLIDSRGINDAVRQAQPVIHETVLGAMNRGDQRYKQGIKRVAG